MNTCNYNIRIYGKVQGVWFRASTKKQAEKLQLKGTVQNTKEGSVFIEVEGAEECINQFINWCHSGPEFARVDKVILQPDNLKQFNTFEIIRSSF